MPSTFGLPENIDGALQQQQSSAVIVQLRKLAVSSSVSGKFNRELWKLSIGPILNLWLKLTSETGRGLLGKPAKLQREEASLSPVESFVVLENIKVFNLVSMVNRSITALSNIINGSGLLTPELFKEGTELLTGAVPWSWAKHWYGPETNASKWVKEVLLRRGAMSEWVEKVEKGVLLASPIHLSMVLSPRTFLNALRQETARATGIAIDNLKLTCTFDKHSLPSTAAVQITIEGVYLQGASFDDYSLGKLNGDSVSLCEVPPVIFCYIKKDDEEPYPGKKDALAVPMYMCTTREEYVCEVRLPCKGFITKWILSGTALMLATY
jgi:dynein heavy chain 2